MAHCSYKIVLSAHLSNGALYNGPSRVKGMYKPVAISSVLLVLRRHINEVGETTSFLYRKKRE
jgi:hypothetical protein